MKPDGNYNLLHQMSLPSRKSGTWANFFNSTTETLCGSNTATAPYPINNGTGTPGPTGTGIGTGVGTGVGTGSFYNTAPIVTAYINTTVTITSLGTTTDLET